MRQRLAAGALAACVAAVVGGLAPPTAVGDAVYRTEHLALSAVGAAPLRSGFVQNIKAEGPEVYAHEVFVLNGAEPNTTYVVKRHFFVGSPTCEQSEVVFPNIAVLETNAAGNARSELFVHPSEIPPSFAGEHGVFWTVEGAAGAYETTCTLVTLD